MIGYIKILIWHHIDFDSIMRCYNLLDQGPCKDGDWLVLDKTVHLDNSLEHSVAKVRFFYESNWLISWLRFLVLSHAQNFYVCLEYPFEFNWNLKSIFENWKFILNLKNVKFSSKTLFLDMSKTFWTCPNQFGRVQNILDL